MQWLPQDEKGMYIQKKKESLDGTLIGEERILHQTLIERLLLLPFASWIMMIAVVSWRTERASAYSSCLVWWFVMGFGTSL